MDQTLRFAKALVPPTSAARGFVEVTQDFLHCCLNLPSGD